MVMRPFPTAGTFKRLWLKCKMVGAYLLQVEISDIHSGVDEASRLWEVGYCAAISIWLYCGALMWNRESISHLRIEDLAMYLLIRVGGMFGAVR